MTTLDRYVNTYAQHDGDYVAVVYDTTTYTPMITAPEGGYTPDDRRDLEAKVNATDDIHFARTHAGEIWKISRYQFNPKSITLGDSRTPPHGGKQRLAYEEIESLGTCTYEPQERRTR